MQTETYSRWLWLALILDIPIMTRDLWYEGKEALIRLPYWSPTEWVTEPGPLLGAAFHGLGFIGIVMAIKGDRRPLLFWSMCHLAIVITLNFSLSMDLADILDRFSSGPKRSILIVGSVIATIAVYIADC